MNVILTESTNIPLTESTKIPLIDDQIAFLTLVIRVMVKPSGFNAPETGAVYPLGFLIGNFGINQGLLNLLNFKHQVDILTCRCIV